MCSVLSITTRVKHPSRDVHASITRLKNAMAPRRKLPTEEEKRLRQWHERINYNVNYYLEHGRLPANVDLGRVRGKGMYDNDRALKDLKR